MKKATNKATSNPSRADAVKEAHKAGLQDGGKVPVEANASDAGWNPYVSMYSVTVTALQLAEIYDNQPGKERRMKILDELAREFNRFTPPPRQ
jgi:hypothetical protein